MIKVTRIAFILWREHMRKRGWTQPNRGLQIIKMNTSTNSYSNLIQIYRKNGFVLSTPLKRLGAEECPRERKNTCSIPNNLLKCTTD